MKNWLEEIVANKRREVAPRIQAHPVASLQQRAESVTRGPDLIQALTDHGFSLNESRAYTALLQSGPFLVDGGTTVAGLSASPERRRTFLFTDGSRHWGIGLASSSSLAELGLILALPGATGTGCRVTRALNLDGGTSCGLYFDRGAGERDHAVEPFKRVRNFVGVAPR